MLWANEAQAVLTDFEIALIVVISAIVVLGIATFIVIKYYNRLMNTRIDDFNIFSAFVRKGGVVFLGDSLTDFFRIKDYFPEIDGYNRGIAGNTTEQVLARLYQVREMEPYAVFLLIGANDLIRMPRKLAKPEMIVDRIMKIAELLPNTKIYISSLYPVNRSAHFLVSKTVCLKDNNKRILAVNKALKARCEEKGYTYIDVHPHLTDVKGNLRKEFTMEGLHLSAKGYCIVADLYRPYIEEIKAGIKAKEEAEKKA